MPALKFSSFLFLLLLIVEFLPAQDKLNIKFGKVKPEDFDIKSALIDSSTNAVVIADVGNSSFVANTMELSFSLVFNEKKRIKIISKNGFDAATIIIPLYVSDVNGKTEILQDLVASTYNLENGKVVETKVAKSSVFTERHSKNLVYKKFTFPGLKAGSIIEYSYGIKSDFFFNLQPWTFQGEYPVLWSQYEAGIPAFYKYVMLAQGYQPYLVNKVITTQNSFAFSEHIDRGFTGIITTGSSINSFTIEGAIDYHTWVMKDVPALKEEAFTTTLDNAVAKIEFQLSQVVFQNAAPHNYMNSWEKVSRELMLSEEFGVPINRPNNWMDKEVAEVVNGATSERGKAEKIYKYVRENFTYNHVDGIYVTTNLKDVVKNKNGSVADINMLLIAMLRNQKIKVNPVILSTRDHGFTHLNYPLLNRYNYIVAKVEMENASYYLDATEKLLDFGRLPSKVYNGHAREITEETALLLDLVADSLIETGTTNVYIGNAEKGTTEGSYTHIFGVYQSQGVRTKMTTTLPDDFIKSVKQEYPEEILIENIQLDSLKLLGEPVALKYDLQFKAFTSEDIVYFNPMLSNALQRNPFAAATRYYPVEMPYTTDNVYTLTMEIPKGYRVDELPKPVKLNLNGDEGVFEYLISVDKDYIQMQSRLMIKKATFVNDDYQSLRDFYAYVVKKEAEQIVFKKTK